DKVWQSKKTIRKTPPRKASTTVAKATSRTKTKATSKAKAGSAWLPKFIPPQLATLSDAMPTGKKWVHEIKFDGYRALAYIRNGTVKMYTRKGLDWTHKFQALADMLSDLPVQTAVLDGEIVTPDEEGISSFKRLKEALSDQASERLQYYVF